MAIQAVRMTGLFRINFHLKSRPVDLVIKYLLEISILATPKVTNHTFLPLSFESVQFARTKAK
jgi:hypothetical protein